MKCPKCSSTNIRYRENRKNYICDECDFVFVADAQIPKRVFVSYGHDEYTTFAHKLADILTDSGYEVFIDRDGIHNGEQWENNLEEGLKWTGENIGNGLFLLLMTPYSVRRPDGYCLNEIAYALDIKLKIYPVMLKKVTPPLSIYRLQYYDLPIEGNEPDSIMEVNISKIISLLEGKVSLDNTGFIRALERHFEPIEFNNELQLYSRNFVGRKWVFETIQDWLQKDKQILMITGMPGFGKSAISTYLYQMMPDIIGFYMFRRNDNEKLSPIRFFSTLAFQIAKQIPEYHEAISKFKIDEIKANCNALAFFNKLISEPLSSIKIEGSKIVIIDGVDEAEQNGQNSIATLLGDCIERLPKNIKFILLTRPVQTSMLPFMSADILTLDAMSDNNLSDIREYIRTANPDISEHLLNEIVKQSEGSFLYAKYLCESYDESSLEQIPRGLSSYYFRYFSSVFDINDYESSRAYLEVILGSPRPLSIPMVASVTGTSTNAVKAFVRKMRALLPQVNDRLKFYHSSLGEWLADEEQSSVFSIDYLQGRGALFMYIDRCIKDIISHHPEFTLEEYKSYTSEVEKQIGMTFSDEIIKLYLELLTVSNDWKSFLDLAAWYFSLPYSRADIKESMANIISLHYSQITKQENFLELYNALKTRFTRRVNGMMENASHGDASKMTPYIAFIAYDLSSMLKPELDASWLDFMCRVISDAFPSPQIKILTSGFSHDDGICGMFADQICDIIDKVRKTDKINNEQILKWMADLLD
jgi:hypothetical protein